MAPSAESKPPLWRRSEYLGGLMQGFGMGIILAIVASDPPLWLLELIDQWAALVVLTGLFLLFYGFFHAKWGSKPKEP